MGPLTVAKGIYVSTRAPIHQWAGQVRQGVGLMSSVLTHTEANRTTIEQADGSWTGTIRCACGWRRVVTDRPNEDAVDLALHGAWVVHTMRV